HHCTSCRLAFLSSLLPPPVLYTLSLHDALPISSRIDLLHVQPDESAVRCAEALAEEFPVSSVLYPDTVYFPTDAQRFPYAYGAEDRKSTRLNSSHVSISYAVFCLKKKT